MKRLPGLLLILLMVFTLACPAITSADAYTRYKYTFFDTFDTVITFSADAKDKETFAVYAALVESEMTRYHQIFDQYHAYEGVNNLYAVNQSAAQAPTRSEKELVDLLLLVREWRTQYGQALNPAMGAVLRLWHDAREEGVALPSDDLLKQAAEHMDYEQVIIDPDAQTVFFADPELSLDLGAVAKGYAAGLVGQTLRDNGLSSFLLNAGGNVVCGEAPLAGRDAWVVAIEDIDGVNIKEKTMITNSAVVTSGDYQRYYTVEGQRYHHLIDPVTLYPALYTHAVSIVTADSGLADFLSTTAFLLPYEQSRSLIESIDGVEAMWTLLDGSVEMTDGFKLLIPQEQ